MNITLKTLPMLIISAFTALMLVVATVVPASATYTQIRLNSYDVMGVTYDHPEGVAKSGYAGEFNVSLYDDVLGWLDPQPAFCVDLDSTISTSTYDIASLLQPAPVGIAWLMDTYAPTSTTVQGAALQSSIWEVLYGDAFNLNGPTEVTSLYTTYMTALGSATMNTDYLLSHYSIVNINGYQNLLVQASSSPPVPEPTTMLLFGAGLLGLAGARRKKIK